MRVPTQILLFLASMTVASSCADRPSGLGTLYHSDFVGIAAIGADTKLAARLERVLAETGIASNFSGSVAYGISVAPEQRTQAVAVLKKDAETHKYWIQFLR